MQLRTTAFVSFHLIEKASATFYVASCSSWKLYGAKLVTVYCRYFTQNLHYIKIKSEKCMAFQSSHFTVISWRYSQQFGSMRNKMRNYMLHVYIIYDLVVFWCTLFKNKQTDVSITENSQATVNHCTVVKSQEKLSVRYGPTMWYVASLSTACRRLNNGCGK